MRENTNDIVKLAFEITKDAFDCSKIGECWLMKVLANFVDSICDIGKCKGEVLESSHNASVFGFINKCVVIRVIGRFDSRRSGAMR